MAVPLAAIAAGASKGVEAVGGAYSILKDIFGPGYKKQAARQLEQQGKLNEQAASTNFKYGEMAAENAYDRQLGLFDYEAEYNSPANQRKRLEDAGLSVGLMYGQGGNGGTAHASTVGQGQTGGAVAGQASDTASQQANKMRSLEVGLAMQQQRAQIKLLEAQARNLNTEADKTAGVDTDLTKATTANTLQNTKNQELAAQGQKIDNEYNTIRNEIAEFGKGIAKDTLTMNYDRLTYETRTAYYVLEEQKLDLDIKEQQKGDLIESV